MNSETLFSIFPDSTVTSDANRCTALTDSFLACSPLSTHKRIHADLGLCIATAVAELLHQLVGTSWMQCHRAFGFGL